MDAPNSSKTKNKNYFFSSVETESGKPIIQPLKSMQEVSDWQPGFDFLGASSVPLRSSQKNVNHPKTLVCHDMAGGYLEDRYIQGVNKSDCYVFYSWHDIDIFIYFSHHFITIPPPCWTNASHQNGVPMLGTLITEWMDGKAICEQFLCSKETRDELINKLVAIADYYKFDGWLLNIENEIESDKIKSLVAFVKDLTEKMHTKLPGSHVLWYDSVIHSGKLLWQNELNSNNSDFFDACDGMFLNYTWKEENLERTKELSDQGLHDVYVGIDVFGRGCKGGGGFNTIEALTAVRSFNLSAAIFAQGWVYEKLPEGKKDFTENEKRFWKLLQPLGAAKCFNSLPLVSCFSQGWGSKFYQDGLAIGYTPWFNMSLQDLQPYSPQDMLDFDPEIGYCGGGSIKISLEKDQRVQSIPLFQTDIALYKKSKYMYLVSYTFKGIPSSKCALKLEYHSLQDPSTQKVKYLVDKTNNESKGSGTELQQLVSERGATFVSGLSREEIPEEFQEFLVGNVKNTWQEHWHCLNLEEDINIQCVSVVCVTDPDQTNTVVNIGNFRMISLEDVRTIPEINNLKAFDTSRSHTTITKSVESESSEEQISELSLTLRWECSYPIDYSIIYHCGVDSDSWEFLGATPSNAFCVCKLRHTGATVKFKVQPVYLAGAHTNLDKAPEISISL